MGFSGRLAGAFPLKMALGASDEWRACSSAGLGGCGRGLGLQVVGHADPIGLDCALDVIGEEGEGLVRVLLLHRVDELVVQHGVFRAAGDEGAGLAEPTGDFVESGLLMQDGVLLAAAEINANGGLLGRPVEIVFVDNTSTA